MKIATLRVHTAPMSGSWLTEGLIANPLSGYDAYRQRRSSWFGAMTAAVVEITTDNGITGLGFAGGAKGDAVRSIIDSHFTQLLLNQDPFDTERLWEQMYRASVMYGRRGVALEAISAVDIALWDIVGKACNQPVYKLIGGRTKDRLPAYVTGNLTERHLNEGFRDVKLALPHSAHDGEQGMRANIALIEKTRALIGAEGNIMLDCYMSLTVPYAIELARRLRGLRITWMEEPVLPDQVDDYRRIRDAVDCMVTGGEHEYSRFGFREWIEKRAVDILQPDIYRAGGITELKRIAAMASAYGIDVIPHGVGAPTYHFIMSTTNSPRAEFVDIFASGGELMLSGDPVPSKGYVELTDAPGFGYTLNSRALSGEATIVPIW